MSFEINTEDMNELRKKWLESTEEICNEILNSYGPMTTKEVTDNLLVDQRFLTLNSRQQVILLLKLIGRIRFR